MLEPRHVMHRRSVCAGGVCLQAISTFRRQLLTGEVEYRVSLVDVVPVVHVESPPPAAAPRLSRATIVGRGANLEAAASGLGGGGLEAYPPPSAEQRA